jgi:hypothetical protein
MAKSYGVTTDIIPAKGGMGPGGVGNIPARSGRGTMSSREELDRINKEYKDYMAGLGKKGSNPPETKVAAPLTKEQTRARDKANKEAQKNLPRRRANPLVEDIEEELVFKKGGMVKSKASSRADGCAIRGKTRA